MDTVFVAAHHNQVISETALILLIQKLNLEVTVQC